MPWPLQSPIKEDEVWSLAELNRFDCLTLGHHLRERERGQATVGLLSKNMP